jgi:TetR/AcrR family transcriptional regulator, transcriptional repressor for nem operon
MENTKEFIIDETFKLFLTHSYEAVSISDISKAIGLTKGALYHHFKNKEELFISVVDKFLNLPELNVDLNKISLFDFIQESNNNFEKLIKNLLNVSETFMPINYLAFFADAFRHYPGYRQGISNFLENEIEKTRIVIVNAIKSGEIRADIDPMVIATNFSSLDFGFAGNLVRQQPLNEAIDLLKKETAELYKLLKK